MAGLKDLKNLIERAETQGWIVTRTKNNHLCWRSPNGLLTHTASTPSDLRAIKNIRANLRRHGFTD